MAAAAAAGLLAAVIGRTGGSNLRVRVGGDLVIDADVTGIEAVWATSLASKLEGQGA
jgi:hypothetical protein